jgi:hypothetical protein
MAWSFIDCGMFTFCINFFTFEMFYYAELGLGVQMLFDILEKRMQGEHNNTIPYKTFEEPYGVHVLSWSLKTIVPGATRKSPIHSKSQKNGHELSNIFI